MRQYYRMDMPSTLAENEGIIAQQETMGKQSIITNKLLGDFDEDGRYTISPDITSELLSLKKYHVDTFSDQYLAESEISNGSKLHFSLTIREDVATISILEKVQFGSNVVEKSPYENIQVTVLDSVVIPSYTDLVKTALFAKYNIHIADVATRLPNELSEDELSSIFYIHQRKLMLESKLVVFNAQSAARDAAEKKLYFATLAALSKCSKNFRKKLLGRFQQNVTDVSYFLDSNAPGYYKAMNEILNVSLINMDMSEFMHDSDRLRQLMISSQREYAKDIALSIPALDSPATKKDATEKIEESNKESSLIKDKLNISKKVEKAAVKSATAKSAPTKSAPTKSAPAKSAPAKSAPAKSAPTKSAPTKSAPEKTAEKTETTTELPSKSIIKQVETQGKNIGKFDANAALGVKYGSVPDSKAPNPATGTNANLFPPDPKSTSLLASNSQVADLPPPTLDSQSPTLDSQSPTLDSQSPTL